MAYELAIDSPVRIFHHKEYGSRLIFVNGRVNPRNLLGKFGVDFHNDAAALSRSVVKVNVRVLLGNGESVIRDMNINRGSLLKYLAAYRSEDVDKNISDDALVSLLNATLEDKHFKPEIRHASKHHQRKLHSGHFFDNLRGKFLSWLYQATINTLSALRKRFFFASSEQSLFQVGEILAKFRFKQALEEVPAYQKLVSTNEDFTNKPDDSKTFEDVPVTTKNNYIKVNQHQDRYLHRHGVYPDGKLKIDASTYVEGSPLFWVRSASEIKTVKKSFKLAAQLTYGERPIHYVNVSATGSSVVDLTAYDVMRASGSVFATTPNADNILDYLNSMHREEQGRIDDDIRAFVLKHAPHFDDFAAVLTTMVHDLLDEKFEDQDYDVATCLAELEEAGIEQISGYGRKLAALVASIDAYRTQTVITGTPGFLREIVDTAIKNGVDFSKYRVRGVASGHAFSEQERESLIANGFAKINSIYGTSDCDSNIGMESDFEIKFRKVLANNPKLAEELYGEDKGLPMVFHCDPFNYHVETDKEDTLIFTCNRDDRSSPRIRYAPGDKGRVFAASDIEALLVKYGINDLKPTVNFPLLFVWGRHCNLNLTAADQKYQLASTFDDVDVGYGSASSRLYRVPTDVQPTAANDLMSMPAKSAKM